MPELDFLESLKSNKAINLAQTCADWKSAVQLCFEPLIKSKIITPNYINGVIQSTEEFGPYYIICPKVAMPHARPEFGALENGFSLLTLTKPVYFDTQPVSILIGFAAKDSEVHLSVALPQIVAIFENQQTVDAISEAKTDDEILTIIKNIDYFKYIK